MNTLCSYEYIIYPWIGKDTLYTAIPGCLGGGKLGESGSKWVQVWRKWGKWGESGSKWGQWGANGRARCWASGRSGSKWGSGEQMFGVDVGK